MPLLKLETTVVLSDDKKSSLLAALSKMVAETIGKPEEYVMIVMRPAEMLMSGKPGETAFVDVRSIGGLNGDVCRKLSQKICDLLNASLGVPKNRIYLNFTERRGQQLGVEWKYVWMRLLLACQASAFDTTND